MIQEAERRLKEGFTLIEILIVVVLLAVIAAVSLPHFSVSLARLQLRNTAYKLAYLMRYAQSAAITRGIEMRLSFDSQFQTYGIEQSFPDDSWEENGGQFQALEGPWGRRDEVPDDMQLTAGKESVVFYPDGQIEKFQANICRETDCFLITTEGVRGLVEVLPFSSDS